MLFDALNAMADTVGEIQHILDLSMRTPSAGRRGVSGGMPDHHPQRLDKGRLV